MLIHRALASHEALDDVVSLIFIFVRDEWALPSSSCSCYSLLPLPSIRWRVVLPSSL